MNRVTVCNARIITDMNTSVYLAYTDQALLIYLVSAYRLYAIFSLTHFIRRNEVFSTMLPLQSVFIQIGGSMNFCQIKRRVAQGNNLGLASVNVVLGFHPRLPLIAIN